MHIEWIFFDVGGVLTDERRFTEWIQEQARIVIRKYDPSITLEKIRQARPTASGMKGNLNENMLRLFLKDQNSAKALTEMKQIRDKGPTHTELQDIRPEALKVVKALSLKYRLGIIANQHKEMKIKLEQAGILQYFTQKNVSEDFDMLKPDPEFFNKILKQSAAQPQNSALVDDNLERAIIPAKKIGLTTVWYKLEDRSPSQGIADFTITSLKELIEIF